MKNNNLISKITNIRNSKIMSGEKEKLTLHLTRSQVRDYKKVLSILFDLDYIYKNLYGLQIEIRTLKVGSKNNKLQMCQEMDSILKNIENLSMALLSKYNKYTLNHISNIYEENIINSKIIDIVKEFYLPRSDNDDKR